MRSRFIFGISLILLNLMGSRLSVFAQQAPIRFRHITYKDGLLQSPVNTMLQDKDGYIWVGSLSGLSRYDGSIFKNFRQSDSTNTGISHNRINRIYEDKLGRLWIGTGGGLNLYDKKTEQFLHVGLSAAKGGANFITAIQQDSYHKIWVATFKGIKYVDATGKRLDSLNSWKKVGENELFQGVAFSLFEDDQQTLWAGIKQGLKRFDPKSQQVLPLPEALVQNKELAAAKIIVIKQDVAGDMWFGTEEDGIFRYNKKNKTCIRYNSANGLPSNWINDILIKEGKVWVATRNGLSIFDSGRGVFTNYNHDSADARSLSDDSVWSLMNDQTGNTWIGTYSGSINLFYPGITNFSNIGERVGNNIGLNKPQAEAIIEDKDQGLWIGSFGGGLNYINRKTGTVKYFPLTDAKNNKYSYEIKALAKDPLGNIWAGTLDGLCKFNTISKSIQYIKLEPYNGKTGGKLINALLTDKEGIWIGTNGAGLRQVTYNGNESQRFIYTPGQNSLSDNYVNALLNDGNILWIGTQNGLNRYDKTTRSFTIFKRIKSTGLGNNNVLSLHKEPGKGLWIGTDGGGLNYLDIRTNKVYAIKQVDGLADNAVTAIIADNSGALWISTNNGLSRLVFKKNSFPTQKGNYQIENYTSANGLLSNQFLVNSALKTSNGELLFGGMNGVTTFFPDRIVKNSYKPAILLTGFDINNKPLRFSDQSELQLPVNETSEITLAYNRNNITIRFSALNFINPEKNTYAYKLSGLKNNEDWQTIGNQNDVSFTNLAPGSYVFTVKAANNDGLWNNTGRSLKISILPPLWQTWWAYCIYIIVLVLLLYKIIQFFQIRARLERDLYNEHLQNEKQEEFYKMKLDFFTNISHEIRTPLTLILGPVENLYHVTMDNHLINKQVAQIKNNAERLLRLISELMDFRKSETGNMVLYLQRNNVVPFLKEIYLSFTTLAESRNITYELIAEQDDIQLNMDRDQLEKVFFNLLSNAFKFVPDRGIIQLIISTADANYLTISVSDNGKGIPETQQQKLFTNFYQVQPDKANPGTGVGLALSKSIVELHQGSITVSSHPQAGQTVFTVKLPYQHAEAENVHLLQDNFLIESESFLSSRAETEVPDMQVASPGDQQYTILLAEDNKELRNFIADSLPHYQVVAFENGAMALEYAVTEIPDLIISDVMMPVMNGFELCNKIKLDERTSHIPVILLTALATHMHQVSGLETGADVYLTKPFSIKLLQLSIQNLLAARELMRKKFSRQISLQPQNLVLNNTDEKFITRLMQVIENHMENPEFGVTELGAEIGMSKSVLFKKVCALTDQSPADFIKSIRLKRALHLLQQNALTVTEVSSLVGFNDRKYFSREFKKQHGKSPTEIVSLSRLTPDNSH
jgi:signal transduction histidine kinase/ligand-binding sensor domain-containing protein/DNA-binding response OmpR family regulator